jgi:hypothetical protein
LIRSQIPRVLLFDPVTAGFYPFGQFRFRFPW